jgi:hypothetical protein
VARRIIVWPHATRLEGAVMANPIAASFKPLDPGRINPMDPVERAWWCQELGCTDEELSQALARVGEHVTEVRAALAQRPPRH